MNLPDLSNDRLIVENVISDNYLGEPRRDPVHGGSAHV